MTSLVSNRAQSAPSESKSEAITVVYTVIKMDIERKLTQEQLSTQSGIETLRRGFFESVWKEINFDGKVSNPTSAKNRHITTYLGSLVLRVGGTFGEVVTQGDLETFIKVRGAELYVQIQHGAGIRDKH